MKSPDRMRSGSQTLLTPRDLSWCRVGQGRYALITAEDGGIVNDPVLLRLRENHFWLAAADSDVLLWAKGVAMNSGMRVEELRRTEPEKKRDWWRHHDFEINREDPT